MATNTHIGRHAAAFAAAAIGAASLLVSNPARTDGSTPSYAPARLVVLDQVREARVRHLQAATVSRSSYGWPVKPFDVQHPVRGYFGDPRIGGHGSKQFHFGVDVSARNGTPVYATITGTVSFIHADAVSIAGAGGLAFEYWHIVPTVRPGEHAVAYRTVVGRVEQPWAHVHFSERRNGAYVNPLRPGAMGPFVDDVGPSVRTIRLRGGTLTADVEDETPLRVPPPWSDLPVMPTVVRWRIVGRQWKTVVDFRTTIPSASAFDVVYAPATRQNHANTAGLYRVRLASGLSARGLAGRTVEVELIDQGGDRTVESRSFGR